MVSDKTFTTSLISLGHIDHGKSTTMGRFLAEIGAIDKRTLDRLEAESKELKRESWKYAYVFDSTEEERQGGITADIAFQPFELDDQSFMLIDAPGHRDFVKNAINGVVLADACIFFVSVVPGDLRSGFKVGTGGEPGGQTREHCILGSVLGIKQVVFALNKMDMVDFSKEAYIEAVTNIQDLLKEIQSPWSKNLSKESFIPISGLQGDNLITKSDNLPWWDGPTLKDALKLFKRETVPNNSIRFLTYDSFEMPGIGTVLYGRMISGERIKQDDEIKILPNGSVTEIKEVFDVNSNVIPELLTGMYGIIALRSFDKDDILPGTVLIGKEDELKPPSLIELRVLVLSNTNRPLIPGTEVILHVGLSHTSARIEEIISIEKTNRNREPSKSKILIARPGELAVMSVEPSMPIIVDNYKNQPILGRAVLRKGGSTIAVGLLTKFS